MSRVCSGDIYNSVSKNTKAFIQKFGLMLRKSRKQWLKIKYY